MNGKSQLKFQVVCYQRGWIIESLSMKIYNDILQQHKNVDIQFDSPKIGADIYIHMIYIWAKPIKGAINWIYVTHVDFWWKVAKLTKLSAISDGFIFMSNESKSKLHLYIKEFHSIVLPPKSLHFDTSVDHDFNKPLIFGLFFNIYPDGRKVNSAIERLINICKKNENYIRLKIYGNGFEKYINNDCNLFLDYDNSSFDQVVYREKLLQCDYVVYFGSDEGAYSILDASKLKIPVLATAQGYHHELNLCSGSLLLNNASEIISTIEGLVRAKLARETIFDFSPQILIRRNSDINNRTTHFFDILKIPFVRNKSIKFNRSNFISYILYILRQIYNKYLGRYLCDPSI